jgi:Ion channel
MADTGGSEFAQRRGWTLRQRMRAPDSYGLLLPLVILSLFATAFTISTLGDVVSLVVGGGTLLFALYTSRATKGLLLAACGLIVLSVVAAIVAAGADAQVTLALGSSVRLFLYLAVLVAILKRLLQHMRVDGATLLGAMCVYLLLGMVFASLFGLIASWQHVAFFTGSIGDGTWADRVYFSYTTMTTVGYGDFTAATGVGRISAISEALIGQLYLVSVVSLVVGNIGRTRSNIRGEPERAGEDSNLRPAD